MCGSQGRGGPGSLREWPGFSVTSADGQTEGRGNGEGFGEKEEGKSRRNCTETGFPTAWITEMGKGGGRLCAHGCRHVQSHVVWTRGGVAW